MKPLADCRLYTFVDSAYLEGRSPVEIARALCEGGADLVQLRGKDWSGEQIEAVARQILPIAREFDAALVINDHPAIAQRVGADLCHLGQEDFFDGGHHHASEFNLPLGLSTHASAQAERALAAGPDYIAIGPVFPTPTKPGAQPVTIEYVRWAAQNVSIPWFAIGGITLENLAEVLAAGAIRVCVVSAILRAPDVAAACGEFARRLRAHRV